MQKTINDFKSTLHFWVVFGIFIQSKMKDKYQSENDNASQLFLLQNAAELFCCKEQSHLLKRKIDHYKRSIFYYLN
ncbi:hypothetical protein IW16_10210 [Chryseobacterium vrystaatense]|uniref:Uncharacterized protein n=1 Tax=Chryseobacterium vrystaatense TaxID=307480 RepID=A0ABR4UNX1_9FLAO|nr:hypothetical protein IW16_10210 [Chryseobacterium vrystaatense]